VRGPPDPAEMLVGGMFGASCRWWQVANQAHAIPLSVFKGYSKFKNTFHKILNTLTTFIGVSIYSYD